MAEAKFTNALKLLEMQVGAKASTGIDGLDNAMGGIEAGKSYLIYSSAGEMADLLALKIAVNMLKPIRRGGLGGASIIIACSNYRTDRTIVDTYLVSDLMKAAGLEPEEYFNKIAISGCYNLEQLKLTARMLEKQIRRIKAKLVALLQPIKLIKTLEDIKRLNGILWRIKCSCTKHSAILIATAKASKGKAAAEIPLPAGSYLKHLFNVIIYLKRSKKPEYAYAYIIKHPLKPKVRRSFEVKLWED